MPPRDFAFWEKSTRGIKNKFFCLRFRDVIFRVPSDASNSLNGNISCFDKTTREMVESFVAPVLIKFNSR